MGTWAKAGEKAKEQYKGKDKHKLDLLQKRIYRSLIRKSAMKAMKASKAKPVKAAMKAMKAVMKVFFGNSWSGPPGRCRFLALILHNFEHYGDVGKGRRARERAVQRQGQA